VANIANGFVTSVPAYAVLRFIAGIGLAGELGAGITLLSEAMPKDSRAYGTLVVSVVGVLGAVMAAMIGDLFDWRMAYFIGGFMGLALLIMRFKASESGMFNDIKIKQQVKRGAFTLIFKSFASTLKYINCILIGIPLWFVIGILITFSPEFGKALKMAEMPTPGHAIMYTYVGISLGSLLCGVLSQWLASRKKAMAIFMVLNAMFMAAYLFNPSPSLAVFYMVCLGLGIACGYWALFVTIAAEQFGTNIRATVATTVPNFVRGAVVPVTLSFQCLKAGIGIISSAGVIGFGCVFVAFLALAGLQETHAKDLNYVE
jgi:MFS family permease